MRKMGFLGKRLGGFLMLYDGLTPNMDVDAC